MFDQVRPADARNGASSQAPPEQPGVTGSPVPPAHRPRSHSVYILAGLAIGIAIGVALAGVTFAYVLPRFAHHSAAAPSKPVPIDTVNLSAKVVLTGTASTDWNVSSCPNGMARPNGTWLCSFSMEAIGTCLFGSLYTVDSIQAEGVTQVSVTPTLPQSICSGNTIAFAVTVDAPYVVPPTINFEIVVDSYT